ncbi:MAG: DMT family transporter, partial [Vitreoscilla sp.]|nr:DMT family transporter [Vitreoscilla sp.]
SGQWQVLVSLSFNRGDLMMLIGVLGWAVYLVLLMPWGKKMGVSAMAMLNLLMLTAVTLMTPLFVWQVSHEGLPQWNASNVATMGYIGVVVSVLSYLAWNYGIAQIGAAKASLSLYTMPVFAAILSYVILGEGLKAYHWIGGAIIVVGLLLASVLGKERKPA